MFDATASFQEWCDDHGYDVAEVQRVVIEAVSDAARSVLAQLGVAEPTTRSLRARPRSITRVRNRVVNALYVDEQCSPSTDEKELCLQHMENGRISNDVLRQALAIWNSNKHPAQPKALSVSGPRERSLRLMLQACGSLEHFEQSVRAFAADPHVNGKRGSAYGLDTMLRAAHRAKWVDAGLHQQQPTSRVEVAYNPADYA